MSIRQAYNSWAEQYDSNANKTRDMEANVLRSTLNVIRFTSVLEIGCGTGKNTVWFAEKADRVLSVDLSEEMLAKARSKIQSKKVTFKQADILHDWDFTAEQFDLVSFSLVLEHIEDLGPVMKKAASVLAPGGHLYLAELHPFKQYSGSKARFETKEGLHVVDCFNHHVSDFIIAADAVGLHLIHLSENFDHDDRSTVPRLLCMVFEK
ncbi:MAG: class I SAM-dependent methyltransferase [Mucilaginibacter polytrichastri]|nr:class I SAM-dependent methyltransferase [Mucilaginibacter polytrichastri]